MFANFYDNALMRFLFLDDSYQKKSEYLGYGGFCIDGVNSRKMADDIQSLKKQFKIPNTVEIKWSPPKHHFLKTKFKGVRQELYRTALQILQKYNAKIICAVHSLGECYPKMYNWKMKDILVWGAKAQLTYIAERFQSIYLECCNDWGIIIADEYGQREGEESIISNFSADMIIGTRYHQLEKICMIPLTTSSKYAAHLQLADVIVGIVVSSLSGSRYGIELFEDVAKMFLTNPYKKSIAFGSTFSTAVLGYGLKLFPQKFQNSHMKIFEALDVKYIVTNEGLREREEDVNEVPF